MLEKVSSKISKMQVHEPDSQHQAGQRYNIKLEEAVSLSDEYILHLDAIFNDNDIDLVAALSDYKCKIYQICKSFECDKLQPAHDNVITGAKFDMNNKNLLYTSSLDGTVKLWDRRESSLSPSLIYNCNTGTDNNTSYPINCFDLSFDGKYICAGSELIDLDAYLLFWDIRKPSLLGGYWDAHSNDVTQVCFNSMNAMISGSTDGLVNKYDIKKNNEEEALESSFNIDSAVRVLKWVGTERFACVTDMETLQLWNIEDAEPYSNFPREEISSVIGLEEADTSYVADIHYLANSNEMYVLAGSNSGKGDYLKSCIVSDNKFNLCSSFINNKQVIRCSSYNEENNMYVTAGESGIITLWSTETNNVNKCDLKSSKLKHKDRKSVY